jgi:hypothetical protein
VKKLSLLLVLALVLGSLGISTVSMANTQTRSFTSTSTAGMFEDMYDYFRLNPAYLPSFKKNSFWGQLSNLENSADKQFTNGISGSSYYLLGGQIDALGLGRTGLMFDWYGATASQPTRDYNYGTSSANNGFQESTVVGYLSSSGSGVIDTKTESYSHTKRVYNYSQNDVYLPYGLGGILGMDLGLALRGYWWSVNPTYDPYAGTAYGSPTGETVGYTFDENTYVRQYNLLSNALVNEFTRTSTGSLDYGYGNWSLTLGGRSKDLMQNLDLLVSVAPVLVVQGNKLKAERVDRYDYQPGNPSLVSNETITNRLEGCEPNANISGTTSTLYPITYPGSGFGVQAGARAEYLYTPSINLIGTVNFSVLPLTLADAKQDTTFLDVKNQTLGGLLRVTDANNVTNDKYEGKTNSGSLYTQLRSQFLAKGWKLGLGVNYINSWSTSDISQTQTYNGVTRVSGTGNPSTDYTATTTSGFISKKKTETYTTEIDLPIGVVFNLLETLPLRFGAQHAIVYSVSNASTEITSRTPTVTQTNYADGSSSSSAPVIGTNTDETSSSSISVTHTNYFYYGMSWWPYKDVQIDFTGFANTVLTLSNYYLSFNFYF